MLRYNQILRRTAVQYQARTFSQVSWLQTGGGTGPNEHITNSTDRLDVHTNAAKSGKADRTSGGGGSQAANEQDDRNNNKRAQEEHPEAPMVIGMNDERGSVRLPGELKH